MRRPLVPRAAQTAGSVAAGGALAGLAAADAGAETWAWLLIVGLAAAAGALLGAFAFLHAGATVRAVSEAATRVGEGELGERVLESSEATGSLTRAFNTMVGRLQEAVAEAEAEQARLSAVFEAAGDATLALGDDTRVRLMNAAAERLLREPRANVLGRPLIESSRDHELDDLVRTAAESGEAAERVITFGLNHVALRASATPIPGGGEWSVLLVLTDLTTVQRFEQLRRDFVSSVSHELRTPLAAIKVMVETVDEGNADPAEAAEFIARTRSEVDRMVALVNDLLDLSRIEAGVVPITMARVDVRGAAEAAARLFEQVTAARGVAISLPPGGVVAWADQEALVHVLTNLIDNAIKFGPPSAPVNVDAHEEDGRVVIEVRDSGPGIEPADLERVFQRFYKADDSRSQAGTGLGLAIVKHLVLAQGGTVEASSGGDGAVFTVRLAQPPEVEAQAAPGR